MGQLSDLNIVDASNTSFSGIGTGVNVMNPSDARAYTQASGGALARYLSDLAGTNQTVGGTANAITLTAAQPWVALANGLVVAFKNTIGPNTGATTINVNALGAKAIRAQGDSALIGGELLANGIYGLRYDTSYNSAAGAWVLVGGGGSGFSGTLTSTDAGASAGPIFEGYRNSASPAVNDILRRDSYTGQNSTPAKVTYAYAQAVIVDPTAGTEDASLDFYVKVNGVDLKAFSAQGTGFPLTSPINVGFVASVGSSALTVAFKGADGTDPSAGNPVFIPFRNVTVGTGTPSYLAVTASTSIVISSGSTMGFTSAVIGRLWIVGFNDGGTFRLGLVNALSGTSIMALRNGIYSSTAEGGAGGADSAQIIYTGTAVTSKAMTVLGYLEATEATAGTWATAPSLIKIIQPGDPLPGDEVKSVRADLGTVASGSTAIPQDNTIPQNTEGVQFFSQAFTPENAADLLRVRVLGTFGASGANPGAMALFRDATANAVAATIADLASTTRGYEMAVDYIALAGSLSSTTFAMRAGLSTGTISINGTGGGQQMGGVMNSFIEITELMA